jgi:histone arginine demethylase JMJD6
MPSGPAQAMPPSSYADLPHVDCITGDISPEKFFNDYGAFPGRPMLLKGLARNWPGFSRWSIQFFKDRYGDSDVVLTRIERAPGGEVRRQYERSTMAQYLDYVQTTTEEKPLYLIDWAAPPELRGDFVVPEYFHSWHHRLPEDVRPKWSWFYIGPARSGSPMHQDVLATSAWNVVIRGKKIWVFYPPRHGSDVYFGRVDAFRPDTEKYPLFTRAKGFKCIQEPGDIVFTPSTWWHQVRNEEGGIAFTENFVNRSNAAKVKQALLMDTDAPERAAAFKQYIPEMFG